MPSGGWEPGRGRAASRARQPSALLIHLCSAQPGLPVQKGYFPCSEVAGIFSGFFFFFQKGIMRRMLCSWQLTHCVRGRKLAGLVTMQIATVKLS